MSRWLRPLALVLALVALAMLAISGPGTRFELFDYRIGLTVFRWCAYAGIAAMVLAVLALAIPASRKRGLIMPVVALLIGALAFGVPFRFQQTATSVPRINDITTDTENPPQYMTTARKYPGEEFARLQRAGYPDIAPVMLPAVPPKEAFERALKAAESMGWEVVGRDAAAGILEAVDTTIWFGFKDDIAVRISAADVGSRIDVRSKSRVGRSDIGTNARRIRAYVERLK
jgi:uncharacterized protein (DUF1499 family)